MATVADLFYHPRTGEHLPASRTSDVLNAAMRVMGLSGWPEGDDDISDEHVEEVRRQLGLLDAPADDEGDQPAADGPPRIPAELPKTVATLIDLVADDPDHKVINQLAHVLTTCMRVLDSDGWPDGGVELNEFQAITILRMLGYHDPASDEDAESDDATDATDATGDAS